MDVARHAQALAKVDAQAVQDVAVDARTDAKTLVRVHAKEVAKAVVKMLAVVTAQRYVKSNVRIVVPSLAQKVAH